METDQELFLLEMGPRCNVQIQLWMFTKLGGIWIWVFSLVYENWIQSSVQTSQKFRNGQLWSFGAWLWAPAFPTEASGSSRWSGSSPSIRSISFFIFKHQYKTLGSELVHNSENETQRLAYFTWGNEPFGVLISLPIGGPPQNVTQSGQNCNPCSREA